MQVVLLEPDGGEARRYTLANGETVIGRRPDCRIILDAPSISLRHARLFSVEGHTVIYGIDDAWPVYVNGETVARHELADGDNIELGHYRMRYVDSVDPARADDGPSPEPEPQSEPGPQSEVDATRRPATGPMAESTTQRAFMPGADGGDAAAGDPASAGTPPDDSEDANPIAFGPPPAVPNDDDPSTDYGESEPAPDDSEPAPSHEYHLDILTGINRGRRVALTQDRVVLGFNQQRLVEIHNEDGTLSLRSVDDEAVAQLNGDPVTGEPAEAKPGDVISLQRIELRIHRAG